MNQTWKTLDIKTKFAIISAVAAFLLGWGLTIAAFIVPPIGEVHDSVLFVLGQALIYTASVFGIGLYFSSESQQLKREIAQMVNEKIR